MTNVRTNLRAFSLIELLLSVFILAIGIISVSALFPAGIAQQAQTADDQLGPVVAEQAPALMNQFSQVLAAENDFGGYAGPAGSLLFIAAIILVLAPPLASKQ